MKLLVMVDRHWAIGKDGDQLVYIPADLRRFQAMTTGKCVILGRKTLQTFPKGAPLKNRRNLVLSRREGLHIPGAEVFASLAALRAAAPEDAFVIGGAAVYEQLLPYCDTAYVTKLHAVYPADRFFPNLDLDPAWACVEETQAEPYEAIAFSYCRYERIE